MAHFPKHLPVQWELFRNEPLKAQVRREALRHQIEEIDKGRGQSDGLWWPDQRYVDVVVPAEYVNPDSIDTFNYRYQVYARPPPVQCEPQTLAEASNEAPPPPLRYNIKRIAQCKPLDNDAPQCWTHWERRPFTLTRPSEQGSSFELQRQSKNNNSCAERPGSHSAANPLPAPASQQSVCAFQTPRTGHAQESKPWTGNVASECHVTRKTPARLSPIGLDTNKNRGFENFDPLRRCETSTESPRSCCSFSSSCASDNNNNPPAAANKSGADLRGDAALNRVPLRQSSKWDSVADTGIAFKESDVGLPRQHVNQAQDPHPSSKMNAADTLSGDKLTTEDRADKQGMDSQRSADRPTINVGTSNAFLKSELSLNKLKVQTPLSERANDVNNNKRNNSGSSTESLRSLVNDGKCFKEDTPTDRSMSKISELSGEKFTSPSEVFSASNERINNGVTVSATELAGRGPTFSSRRGKRFGYNTAASKDSVCSLLVGGEIRGGNVPSTLSPIQPKPSQPEGFPLTHFTSLEMLPAPGQRDSVSLARVKKGGKRTGYQAKAVKDSIVFGGGLNLKDLSFCLYNGGKRRSCQTGGYRSLANSDNMKNLIFQENVNSHNAQRWPSDKKYVGESTFKIDLLIFEDEARVVSTTISPKYTPTSPDSSTADSDLPILPFCSAASLCTNNNSEISDPILNIQLDRSCQLPDERQLRRPSRGDNRLHADGRQSNTIPYDTYRIVGGLQYRSRPPDDLLSELRLPPHLAEYQEFTRRCPNYKVGRYDRSDPANEMLLPSNKTMHTLRMTLDPFMYARNPKAGKIRPLFYTTTGNSELSWPMAVPKAASKSTEKSL